MGFRPDRPFNDLPDLPPAQDLETKPVLKACIEARAALAELRISGRLFPNPAVLMNSIPLLEAQASSEIEAVVTTTDRLFRFAHDGGGQADPATREVLRNHAALRHGFEMLRRRPLTTAVAVEVCRLVKGVDLDIRATSGAALANDATGAVIYTPPEGADLLRAKLANWERYLHEAEDVDPLVRLAVGHSQFEAIHPFIDGNGRTGRALNLLYLTDQRLLDVPVLPLSRYLLWNQTLYYRHLLEVASKAAWEPWILFMLEGIQETAQWTVAAIQEIRDLLERTLQSLRRSLPKIASRELTELIFANPFCRIGDLVEAGLAKRQTAAVYLKALASEGFVQEVKEGRKNLYLNRPFLAALAKPEQADV